MTKDMKLAPENRVSFSFYAQEVRALRRLTLALRDLGADVERADTIRLLLFACSEAELFSYAVLQLQADAKSRDKTSVIEERFTVRVPVPLLAKVSHAADDLARKDIDVDKSFLIRALVNAPHDPKALLRALPKMHAAFPDGRVTRHKKRG